MVHNFPAVFHSVWRAFAPMYCVVRDPKRRALRGLNQVEFGGMVARDVSSAALKKAATSGAEVG